MVNGLKGFFAGIGVLTTAVVAFCAFEIHKDDEKQRRALNLAEVNTAYTHGWTKGVDDMTKKALEIELEAMQD